MNWETEESRLLGNFINVSAHVTLAGDALTELESTGTEQTFPSKIMDEDIHAPLLNHREINTRILVARSPLVACPQSEILSEICRPPLHYYRHNNITDGH